MLRQEGNHVSYPQKTTRENKVAERSKPRRGYGVEHPHGPRKCSPSQQRSGDKAEREQQRHEAQRKNRVAIGDLLEVNPSFADEPVQQNQQRLRYEDESEKARAHAVGFRDADGS